jgi:hypothetical protein
MLVVYTKPVVEFNFLSDELMKRILDSVSYIRALKMVRHT